MGAFELALGSIIVGGLTLFAATVYAMMEASRIEVSRGPYREVPADESLADD